MITFSSICAKKFINNIVGYVFQNIVISYYCLYFVLVYSQSAVAYKIGHMFLTI